MHNTVLLYVVENLSLPSHNMQQSEHFNQIQGIFSSMFDINKSGHRYDIIINNPDKRNAVTKKMWQQIPELMKKLAADPDCRVVVFSGSGQHFVSGADIAEFKTERHTPQTAAQYEIINEEAFAAIRECPKPTLALIRGYCIGGGFGIAAACDMRLGDTTSQFCIPPAKLGIVYPPLALADIVNLIGVSTTKDLIFSARLMPASEALQVGFLNRLVQPDELNSCCDALVEAISQNAPLTISATKRALSGIQMTLNPAIKEELDALATSCLESWDCAEGRHAFLEKRKPVFKGC